MQLPDRVARVATDRVRVLDVLRLAESATAAPASDERDNYRDQRLEPPHHPDGSAGSHGQGCASTLAPMLTAAALWWVTRELVLALDERIGPPVDSYVNGSQTWFSGDTETLEWRLHPVAAFSAPRGISHYDLWEQVVAQLSTGADPAALALGDETRALTSLWDGLECFAAYGEELEPATLASRTAEALGRAPDVAGLVDHDAIGDAWESAHRTVSITRLLADQLRA